MTSIKFCQSCFLISLSANFILKLDEICWQALMIAEEPVLSAQRMKTHICFGFMGNGKELLAHK